MNFGEGKQLASDTTAMAKTDADEIAQSSKWHDDEATKAEETEGLNSVFLAECGDMVGASSDHLKVLWLMRY
jgi:hypothetical protein